MSCFTPSASSWVYTPSCPCDACEDYRADNGMTCVFGLRGWRPPSDTRPHRGVQS
ncbi:hypothetical protein [Mycobacterium phage Fezzik]|nr:hypothetical protein [Mycobacterium phage Fezzik]